VLAGIIIAAVLGLVRLAHLVKLWRLSRAQAATAWTTFLLTLALAPRVDQAIILGILASVGVHLWRELPVAFDTWRDEETIHLAIRGVLWFGSAPAVERAILAAVAEYDQAHTLAIHLEGVGRLDLTGALMLQKVIEDPALSHLKVRLEGVPEHAHRILANVMDWEPAGALEEHQEIRRKIHRIRTEGPEAPVPPTGRRTGSSPSALQAPPRERPDAAAEGPEEGDQENGQNTEE
jgi:MFS superfamily sulfate permease-like transporter